MGESAATHASPTSLEHPKLTAASRLLETLSTESATRSALHLAGRGLAQDKPIEAAGEGHGVRDHGLPRRHRAIRAPARLVTKVAPSRTPDRTGDTAPKEAQDRRQR
eukprot:scaffold62_cov256-Pinguiococcus_pyrenoidosus.AAC.8